jgi:putative ABC transport system substrate-binding protein
MRVRSLRRREFIAVLGGAAAWPFVVDAQQPDRVRRLGVLMSWPEDDLITRASVTAFAQALGRFGWVEGKSIRIDYRFAAGDPTLYKTYAAELVGLAPDAILAGPTPAVAALREQTRTIPIVFVLVVDPVALGFVQSFARPGGNITGFSSFDAPMMGNGSNCSGRSRRASRGSPSSGQKVLFIDFFQHHCHGALRHLVFEGWNAEWPL